MYGKKMLKRRTDAESNARKTDGTDGSELQNTLKGMEHGKGAEVRNKVRKKGEYGAYNVGVKDLASAYVLCPRGTWGSFDLRTGQRFTE